METTADLARSAKESEAVALGRYKEGVGSILDLLSAQSAMADARSQQVQAQWGWFMALAQLTHDAGLLTAARESPFEIRLDK